MSTMHYIRRWISRKPLEVDASFQRTTNRKWPMGYQMVRWPMTSCDPQRCCEAVRSASLATAWLLDIPLSAAIAAHVNRGTSQLSPFHSGEQRQWYWLLLWTQVPPLRHGLRLLSHQSTKLSQRRPVNPGWHEQSNNSASDPREQRPSFRHGFEPHGLIRCWQFEPVKPAAQRQWYPLTSSTHVPP